MIIKRSSQKEQPKPQSAVNNDIPSSLPSPSAVQQSSEPQVPLSFEDIVFDSRQERRQGSRRRGYRRIDDRNTVSRAQEEANSIREQAVKEGHKIGIENAEQDIQALRDAIVGFFKY